MNAQISSNRPCAGRDRILVEPVVRPRAHTVLAAATPLLTDALPHVDWADAYAVDIPSGAPRHDPQTWADEIFHTPSPAIRFLFGVREALVRVVGIEPGSKDVFATMTRTSDEVLIGADQGHLSFRASVLVERERVVLSTVVKLHNRRGRAYSALVRMVHPWVVRTMLARAAGTLTVTT